MNSINRTADIYRLFLNCSRANFQRPALGFADCRVTYGELERLAEAAAERLLAAKMQAGDVVIVDGENYINLAAGVLGVMKAGGVFTILDNGYPAGYVRRIFMESGGKYFLTAGGAGQTFLPVQDPTIGIEQVSDDKSFAVFSLRPASQAALNKPASKPAGSREQEEGAKNTAAILYSSNFTGKPSGIVLSGADISSWLDFNLKKLNVDFSHTLFIASLRTIISFPLWLAGLVSGGYVYFIDKQWEVDMRRWENIPAMFPFTCIVTPLTQLCDWSGTARNGCGALLPGTLKNIISAGEDVFPIDEFKNCLKEKKIRWHNYYGFPEIRFITTIAADESQMNSGFKHIGKPAPGSDAYILDRFNQLVSVGLRGELYVSGPGMSDRLYGPEDKGRTFFVEIPALAPGKVLLKTGYRAAWLPDWKISLFGSSSETVVLNGYCITVEEIEAAVLFHPAVEACAGVVRESITGKSRLTVYLVLKKEVPFAELEEFLKGHLPGDIFPIGYFKLAALPGAANGAIDKKILEQSQIIDSLGVKYLESELRKAAGIQDAVIIITPILAEQPGAGVAIPAGEVAASGAPYPDMLRLGLKVCATFTPHLMAEYASWWARKFGINLKIEFSPYNQVFQQLSDKTGLLSPEPGVVLLLVRFEDWIRYLETADDEEKCRVIERNFRDLVRVFLNRVGREIYFVGIFPISTHLALNEKVQSVIRDVTARWKRIVETLGNVYVIDFTGLQELFRVPDVFNAVMDRAGHLPFSREYYAAMWTMVARKLICLHMREEPSFKVIILSLDNISTKNLEHEQDGPGSTLRPFPPGAMAMSKEVDKSQIKVENGFARLQEFMETKRREGFKLALFSRITEPDAGVSFDNGSPAVLKRKHFIAVKIDKKSLPEKIGELSRQLDIGLERFIFVGENHADCALLMEQCPGVLTLPLPADPRHWRLYLEHVWAFDRIGQDGKTGRTSYEEQETGGYFASSPSLENFLTSLGLEVSLGPLTDEQIKIAAKLTHQVNQFNLSAIMRKEEEIHALRQKEEVLCWGIEAQDRFGDYGLSGILITEKTGRSLFIDSFLLSCAVLGKGVEDVVLAGLKRYCEQQQLDELLADFSPAINNMSFRVFLRRTGWQHRENGNNRFRLETERINSAPGHARLHYFDNSGKRERACGVVVGENIKDKVRGAELYKRKKEAGFDGDSQAAGGETGSLWLLPSVLNEGILLHRNHLLPPRFCTAASLLDLPVVEDNRSSGSLPVEKSCGGWKQLIKIFYSLEKPGEEHDGGLVRQICGILPYQEKKNAVLELIRLKSIPKTQDGVDYERLRQLEKETKVIRIELDLPQTGTEKKLAAIWRDLLGKPHIGIDDHFFTLGGHSLKATILVARIHKELGVNVSLGQVFITPTLRGLAEYIDSSASRPYVSIPLTEKREYYALSSAQERLYVIQQMDKKNPGYNLPQFYTLYGEVDTGKLAGAFKTLIARHEILRTSYRMVAGEPVQIVHDHVEFLPEYYEAESDAQAGNIIKDFIRPFDLSRAPLFRAGLIGKAAREHIFILEMHHTISDGTSQGIFMEEFIALYNGEPVPARKLQYKDYSCRQRKAGGRDTGMKKQQEYWQRRFAGKLPVLKLPLDFPRPLIQDFSGCGIDFILDAEITGRLNGMARSAGATLFMVLLSVVKILLFKICGQEDIIVGTPIAGRPHAELQNIIGMFVNTLAIRTRPRNEKTFKEYLSEVRSETLMALENREYQFSDLVDSIVKERDMSRNPIFDVFFVLENFDMVQIELAGLRVEPAAGYRAGISRFDLSFGAFEIDSALHFVVEYCVKLFKAGTIERFIRNFKEIISTILDDVDCKLEDIKLSHPFFDKEIALPETDFGFIETPAKPVS